MNETETCQLWTAPHNRKSEYGLILKLDIERAKNPEIDLISFFDLLAIEIVIHLNIKFAYLFFQPEINRVRIQVAMNSVSEGEKNFFCKDLIVSNELITESFLDPYDLALFVCSELKKGMP